MQTEKGTEQSVESEKKQKNLPAYNIIIAELTGWFMRR